MPEEKKFNVHIFQVEPKDSTFLTSGIQEAEASQPDIKVNDRLRRLENSRLLDDCYLLNFVTKRYPGPSYAKPEEDVHPIELEPDELFAYETAMLYEPDRSLVFLESTKPGMGPGAIVRYFEKVLRGKDTIALHPVIDEHAVERAMSTTQYRSVKMRVALTPDAQVSNVDPDFRTLTKYGESLKGGYMDIVIAAVPYSRNVLDETTTRHELKRMLRNRKGKPPIEKLIVTGKKHRDDPTEIIDLLQHYEKRTRKLPVDDKERKVLHEIRWEALLGIRSMYFSN